jgi:hypothetical protein
MSGRTNQITVFLFLIFCHTVVLPTTTKEVAIDAVYLWVDGSDPAWQSIKEQYLQGISRNFELTTRHTTQNHADLSTYASDSLTDNRFIDNEELRYSLRSLVAYAPYIRHIYIITMDQRPAWLEEHPMITIIDHTEIFKDPSNLPTFNSQALESNIHRIPDLSEYFIYFNDDVFLGTLTTPKDFFIDGKPNVLFEKSLSPDGPPLPEETAYRRAWRNTNRFLNQLFYEEPRYRLAHAPFALRKSFMEAFDTAHPEIFAINSSHKFRSNDDYNVTNGLLQYYWKYRDAITSEPLSNMMISLRGDIYYKSNTKKLKKLVDERPLSFCIQDVMSGDSQKTKLLLRKTLEFLYPIPAPWEKRT